MQFKDFEIRPATNITGKSPDGKYELIKWREDDRFGRCCFVLAFLEWNKKECYFEFRGVGMRYQEYYEDGLNEYVLRYTELLALIEKKKVEEKEG